MRNIKDQFCSIQVCNAHLSKPIDSSIYRGSWRFGCVNGITRITKLPQVNRWRVRFHRFWSSRYDSFDTPSSTLIFIYLGVLFTTPGFDVFESTIEAAKFYLEMPSSLNASSTAFSEAYVRSRLLGELAEMRAKKYASHVSTATVATDMLSIINAIGCDKLQFWGFSYVSSDMCA